MTRKFGQRVQCPDCRNEHTAECGLSRWVRGQADLDSAEGTVIGDTDLIIHRFKVRSVPRGEKLVQYLMIVESKSFGGDMNESQRDTMHIVNQLIRTHSWSRGSRRNGRFTSSNESVRPVYSTMNGRKVQVICYGVHKLIMSGGDPVSSLHMSWDGKKITEGQLLLLLKFDLHPDNLRPMEHRAHKRKRPVNKELW